MVSNEEQPVKDISTQPETGLAENSSAHVEVVGCSNQGIDSLPMKFETEQAGIGQYSVSNHAFSLSKPMQARSFLPLEQPFHKPPIQIVPTVTYAADNPETRTARPILPCGPGSQQQMYITRHQEMVSGPNTSSPLTSHSGAPLLGNGLSAAPTSVTGTIPASHEAGSAHGTGRNRQSLNTS